MRIPWWIGLALGFLARNAPAQTYYLIVSGVGGEAEYTDRLTQWGRALANAARSRLGVPDSNVRFLAEQGGDGAATKEELGAALRDLAGRAGASADVIIVLFGHGSDRGDEARFNLVGPDITATELAGLIEGLHARHIVVVNTTSASGGFVKALSAPGRIVVTATKSGYERNWARFGEFFVKAADASEGAEGADADKDGRVSVLEAFRYAAREVARAYQQENRLLTEHAVLDDNGDGQGSAEPSDTTGDGALAAEVFLGPAAAAVAAGSVDSALRDLFARRDSLNQEIAELKGSKARLAPEVYQQRLEALLVALATTAHSIRERESVRRP